MKSVRSLLQEADPLQHEPPCSPGDREFRRQTILAAASVAQLPSHARSRLATFATISLILIAASLLGPRAHFLFVGELQAAVRFEVRLAEDKPSPGLREVRASSTEQPVYLHEQAVVTNSDIASAYVLPNNAAGQFAVAVEFNASGAKKMLRATTTHIGKPMAILIDGQLAVAPLLRSPISTSAVVTGIFTKAEAERIANGIRLR
jgi:preprotein translocase subunit SecD